MGKKIYSDQPHLNIASKYDTISFEYHNKKDYDQALQYYQLGLDIRQKVCGDEPPPDIANTCLLYTSPSPRDA